MSKILIPAENAEQWKCFLAKPKKQWKKGYSARALAYCWQEANGFPAEVKVVLEQAPQFHKLGFLFGIPEHQVSLPGGSRPSQNDIWVLARCNDGLISIAVEGKVAESFGPTIHEWNYSSSKGRQKRLTSLCSTLGIEFPPPGNIRYQLIHRAASAVIEAQRFHAKYAVMLVHSFSPENQWFDDYQHFLSLFNATGAINKLSAGGICSGINLLFAWVHGDKKYLYV